MQNTLKQLVIETLISRVDDLIKNIDPDLKLITFKNNNKYKTQSIFNTRLNKPVGVFHPQDSNASLTFNYQAFNELDENVQTNLLKLIPITNKICKMALDNK